MLVENCEIEGLLKTSEYKGPKSAHGSIIFSDVSIGFRKEAETDVFLEINDAVKVDMIKVKKDKESLIPVREV